MAKKSKQTATQRKLEERQLSEIEKLDRIEAQQKLAAGRRTRGRASLISGSEQGTGGDPAFAEKNLATKERLGSETEAVPAERSGGIFKNKQAAGAVRKKVRSLLI